jgi:hypothetical protein
MWRKEPRFGPVTLSVKSVVEKNPGIHFRGLCRAANLTSVGQLRHHLDRLGRAGVVIEVSDGRYKRFFLAGQQEARLRETMARLSRAVPSRIAAILLAGPKSRTELRHLLGCADSTLGYHLRRMLVAGDLERVWSQNRCIYSLATPDSARRAIQARLAAAKGEDAPMVVTLRDVQLADRLADVAPPIRSDLFGNAAAPEAARPIEERLVEAADPQESAADPPPTPHLPETASPQPEEDTLEARLARRRQSGEVDPVDVA